MEWLVNVATLVATTLAAVGLLLTARSNIDQARSNDLNSLFYFVKELREAETRLLLAVRSRDVHQAEIVNYLNILEVSAAAVNRKLFGRSTREMAMDRLVNDISILMSNDLTLSEIENAITAETTFQELGKFAGRHREIIKQRTSQNKRKIGSSVSY